jgi:UDP-N-acetylglucosamine--N-acetylmuramyl-(pentapeptide) pyrophosphoryl-undecaprenol N-acetylglucosamine transferase
MKLVITGGHHSSALPVIELLRRVQNDASIYWIGHRISQKGNKADTLEYIEITNLNIPFYDLKAGKFYKPNSLSHYLKIPLGFFQSLYYLIKIKPDLILSFGGYIAVPVVIVGWFLGIPTITHEQTVVTGYANKLISKFAKKIFVSWEESLKYFPPEKVRYSGLPLRESINKIVSNNYQVDNGLPYILVIGGKTGSHLINTLIEESLETLLSFSNVVHQTGDHTKLKDFERLCDKYQNISTRVFGAYYPKKFIFEDEIGEVYSKADLVVSRAGAHSISEIIALNKKAILIPISWVSHNEQFLNAKIVESRNNAVIIDENEINKEDFIEVVKKLLNQEVKEPDKTDKKTDLPEEIIVNEIISTIQEKEEK